MTLSALMPTVEIPRSRRSSRAISGMGQADILPRLFARLVGGIDAGEQRFAHPPGADLGVVEVGADGDDGLGADRRPRLGPHGFEGGGAGLINGRAAIDQAIGEGRIQAGDAGDGADLRVDGGRGCPARRSRDRAVRAFQGS